LAWDGMARWTQVSAAAKVRFAVCVLSHNGF